MSFALALRDTNEQPTIGITRTATTLSSLNKDTDDQALKILNQWNSFNYMNIWLVKEICNAGGCGTGGYAYFASAHGQFYDGIVNLASLFGSDQDKSKVHVHEVGHYLDLNHTFDFGCPNDDCTVDGDRVCDTPPENSSTGIACDNIANTCNTDEDDTSVNNPFRPVAMGGIGDQNDLIEDYMDYGYSECKDRFTQGQKDKMRIALTGIRASLLSSDGCDPAATPISIFSGNPRIICTGSSVQFNEASLNGTTSWTWAFENGTPSSSNDQNPSITFNSPGAFDVSLLSSNNLGNGTTETKSNYILVYENIIAPACTVTTDNFVQYCGCGILNVTLQNINNTTGDAYADGGYTDFSCYIIDTLTAEKKYPINITAGLYQGWDLRVYIDYNNDGSFNNTDELVLSLDSVINLNTDSIVISNVSVKNKIIRMRVITDYEFNTISNACNSVGYGQAEDYGIIIKCSDDIGEPPVSNFTSDKIFGCPGAIINFLDISQKCPSSWNWTINGGNPTSSSSPSLSSTFNTAGSFRVDLTASNSYGTGTTVSKSSYIKIYDFPDSTCTPVTTNLTNNYGMGIINVKFQNINNTTGMATVDSGYLDFSCSIIDSVRAGSTYSVDITTGSGNPLNLEDVKIYIDWDGDGILNSTNELAFESQNIFTTHTGNIIVPSTAVTNELLRMRVISDYYTFNISSSCYNSVYGQSEDYGLIVKCATTMQAATTFSNASCDTCPDGKAAVSVSGGTPPYSYLWNDPLQQSTPEASGLIPGNYAVIITDSSNCELIIEPIQITGGTISIPTSPSNLTAIVISSSQINISWKDNSSGETGFIIARSTDNTNFSKTDTVLENITNFSDNGLTASTQYYYKVAAYNAVGISVYSNTVVATTLVTDIKETLITKDYVIIYPNPSSGIVKIEWNGNKNAPLQIFNIMGEKVLEQPSSKEIYLSDKPNGIYFGRINDDGKIINVKIIIMK